VTFEDLKNAGCPPLRVVAADISKRELRLFSSETSPEVGVASAVAASVCLPVIFKPWRIGSHLHLDGGLVSNLPAWAFDAERALDRDAWTAVVQVGDAPEAERLFGWRIIKAGILTGIFGSGLLNMRNVDRLKAIRLDVDLKLLQFDPGLDLARQVAEAARSRCVQELVYQLRDVPELMTDICERVRLRVERTFNRALSLEEKSPFTGKLRVSIFVRHREDSSSLAADFQIGFDSAPDERLRVPLLGSIVGQALRENEPLYLDRSDPTWTSYLSRPGERWLRKSVWPDLRWVFCVPYVNLVEGIAMVVAVDSDSYLEVEDDLVDVVLESISDSVVLMLDQFLPKEAFSDGGT
jgi:NTE family protein